MAFLLSIYVLTAETWTVGLVHFEFCFVRLNSLRLLIAAEATSFVLATKEAKRPSQRNPCLCPQGQLPAGCAGRPSLPSYIIASDSVATARVYASLRLPRR